MIDLRRMRFSRRWTLLFCAGVIAFSRAQSAVVLPPVLADHAVLQRSAQTAVWGTAAPGEQVSASLGTAHGQATTGHDGKWRIELDLSTLGPGPFELTIAGTNTQTLTDVMIGEVWIASGQSNMEFPLKYTNDSHTVIAASADPRFRQFRVNNTPSPKPLDSVDGKWTTAGPDTSGNFTAVGYYFGTKLRQELDCPVAIIYDNWGGTPDEAWTSAEALASSPTLKDGAIKSRESLETFPAQSQAYTESLQRWEKKYDRDLSAPEDGSPYAQPGTPTTDWTPVHLPGPLAAAGAPNGGVVWLRRVVTIPQDAVASHASLQYGALPGFDSVYWNGQKFGESKPEDGGLLWGRKYFPTANLRLTAGDGVLAIRIALPMGGGNFPAPMRWGSATLDGEWLAKVEKSFPAPSPDAVKDYPKPLQKKPDPQHVASYLFNGMISPMTSCTIKGVIWYQGEADADHALEYRTSFPLMIADWRDHWHEGDFPFYFCQLANFMQRKPTPTESAWAELREAQAMTLSVPHTGMAVLIDVGDEMNIHPHDKQTPGERLAAAALANTYGKAIPFAGPSYTSMAVEGDSVRVRFAHAEGGLVAHALPAEYAPTSEKPDAKVPLVRNSPNSEIEGFAICGDDHVWKWADARIDKDSVVVHADGVAKPVAVRYAWADDPICNLYNGAGFPAVPFRTDDFPLITRNNKF